MTDDKANQLLAQREAEYKSERVRLQKLIQICDIDVGGSLSKGLQNYQGVTLMDTLKLMSLVNMKQSTRIIEQLERIDAELTTRTREEYNPADLDAPKLRRPMTPAEEHMLREDRRGLMQILTLQHNQKIKEVALEIGIQNRLNDKKEPDKRSRKPGFTPMEIDVNGASA